MDNKKTAAFVSDIWDNSIVPELCEYIKVPNKSPLFDPDWMPSEPIACRSPGLISAAIDARPKWKHT